MTRMVGTPEHMEREQRFLTDLAREAQWSWDEDQLVLGDSDGVGLIRLAPAASAP